MNDFKTRVGEAGHALLVCLCFPVTSGALTCSSDFQARRREESSMGTGEIQGRFLEKMSILTSGLSFMEKAKKGIPGVWK